MYKLKDMFVQYFWFLWFDICCLYNIKQFLYTYYIITKTVQQRQQNNKMLTLHVEVTGCHFCPHSRVERQNPKCLRSNKNFIIGATAVQQLKAEWEQSHSKQSFFIQLKPSQTIHTYVSNNNSK